MNYWIAGKPGALKKLLGRIDLLLINDGEIRQLTGETKRRHGGRGDPPLGPRAVVVKRGEHGVVGASRTPARSRFPRCRSSA